MKPEFHKAKEKADAGKFLSIRELAIVTGVGQNKMLRIAKEPGFPLFEKKVTLQDFQAWYRAKIGLQLPTPLKAEENLKQPEPLRARPPAYSR